MLWLWALPGRLPGELRPDDLQIVGPNRRHIDHLTHPPPYHQAQHSSLASHSGGTSSPVNAPERQPEQKIHPGLGNTMDEYLQHFR
jgi:hypothetical protein